MYAGGADSAFILILRRDDEILTARALNDPGYLEGRRRMAGLA